MVGEVIIADSDLTEGPYRDLCVPRRAPFGRTTRCDAKSLVQ